MTEAIVCNDRVLLPFLQRIVLVIAGAAHSDNYWVPHTSLGGWRPLPSIGFDAEMPTSGTGGAASEESKGGHRAHAAQIDNQCTIKGTPSYLLGMHRLLESCLTDPRSELRVLEQLQEAQGVRVNHVLRVRGFGPAHVEILKVPAA